jgi:hypothetical protein
MKKLLLAFLLFAGFYGLCAQTTALTVPVPIQNPSFEQGATGWQFENSSGVTQVAGKEVAYAGYGGTFSQELSTSPAEVQALANPAYHSEGVYTLKFSVTNYFPTYPGLYNAEIDFGLQELCESYGWATGKFTQVTLTCPSSNYLIVDGPLPGTGGPVQGAEKFSIHFTVNDGSANGGWTVLFKDVSLTFTPN